MTQDPRYGVVVADGGGKPDWWSFNTLREARAFAAEMYASGYREIIVTDRTKPQPTRDQAAEMRHLMTQEGFSPRLAANRVGFRGSYRFYAPTVGELHAAKRRIRSAKQR